MNSRTRAATSIRQLGGLRQMLFPKTINISPAMLIVLWISLWPLVSPPTLRAQTHGRSGASLRITIKVAPAILNIPFEQANRSIASRDAITPTAGQFLIWPEARPSMTVLEEARSLCESGWQGEPVAASPTSAPAVLEDLRKGATFFGPPGCKENAVTPAVARLKRDALILTRTIVSR